MGKYRTSPKKKKRKGKPKFNYSENDATSGGWYGSTVNPYRLRVEYMYQQLNEKAVTGAT